MSARLIVTGATGFIGRGTLDGLRAAGFDVHALTRSLPDSRPPGVEFHQIDLHDAQATESLCVRLRPECLLHLAWDVTPGIYTTSLENVRWVQASLNLVNAFVRAGGRRVVAAGTSSEYDWQSGLCSEASTPLKPSTLYASCKHGLHVILTGLAKQTGNSLAWGRVFFLYGPGEHPSRLVPAMIGSAMRGEAIRLRHPQQARDYLHVQDVASAFVALARSPVNGPVNIGAGEPIVLRELASMVQSAVGAAGIVAQEGSEPDLHPVVYADTARLRNEVGWRPRFSLAEGLRDTVDWWKRHDSLIKA